MIIENPKKEEENKEAELLFLYIAEDEWWKGHGRNLLKAMHKRLSEKKIKLIKAAVEYESILFFLKNGFKKGN